MWGRIFKYFKIANVFFIFLAKPVGKRITAYKTFTTFTRLQLTITGLQLTERLQLTMRGLLYLGLLYDSLHNGSVVQLVTLLHY